MNDEIASGIPDDVRVLCLVSLGFAVDPPKVFPGRLPFERLVFWEAYGQSKPQD